MLEASPSKKQNVGDGARDDDAIAASDGEEAAPPPPAVRGGRRPVGRARPGTRAPRLCKAAGNANPAAGSEAEPDGAVSGPASHKQLVICDDPKCQLCGKPVPVDKQICTGPDRKQVFHKACWNANRAFANAPKSKEQREALEKFRAERPAQLKQDIAATATEQRRGPVQAQQIRMLLDKITSYVRVTRQQFEEVASTF